MLQIDKSHLEIVQSILTKYPYQFYAYGSRVKENARNLSDLDLCYQDNIPDSIILEIDDQFRESDLPFIVDIVDWKKMNLEFQKMIEKDLLKI